MFADFQILKSQTDALRGNLSPKVTIPSPTLLHFCGGRAGDFRPLRFLSKNKFVVLGLPTNIFSTIESKDDLKRRIEEAAQYAPQNQLCLSPQCEFSSTVHGNDIAMEDQKAKLRLVVESAEEVQANTLVAVQ